MQGEAPDEEGLDREVEARARVAVREERRRGFLGRFSRRLKERELPEPEEIDLDPIVKEIDAAIASRRRRLNAKMGSTLKELRDVRSSPFASSFLVAPSV